MRLKTLQKFKKLFNVLVATVAVVMLVVVLFVAHVLNQSRQRYYANAEETSRNLAISLENFMYSHFQDVDLAMRRAALEFRTLHAQHRFEDEGFSAYLRSLKERIPNAVAVRGSDRDGRVIYGEGIDFAHVQDLTVREFFPRVKTSKELVFGVPVKSRISGQWVLPLIYPMRLPDGAFGGTAYVNMNTARMDELFSSLHLGAHGTIVVVDQQKRLIQRYPAVADQPVGSTVPMPPQSADLLEGKQRSATYSAVSWRDDQQRVLSMEKVGDYPIYVLVSLSSEDFLEHWYKEVRNGGIFVAVLLALAAGLLLGVRYSLGRQYQSLIRVIEADKALQVSMAALTESESRWRSLTEGLPQMVWTVTPALRLDFLSHHWEAFSGVPAAELLASGDWASLVHPDDRAALAQAWQLALEVGSQFRCAVRLRQRGGAWRVFDNQALPQRDADGAIAGWVGGSTDITEARAAHDALELAKEQAVQAGRAKSEFVANMSHEIRSPMNAVLGMLQLLQQTGMNERQQDYAAKAHAAARALLGLLNDILDFSKVEAGKLALDPHPFRLDKLWRDLAVILSANVGDKNIEVLFRIDPALPAEIVGDALRLQQILLNLAGNAIKFTEQGEVLLSAQLLAETDKVLSIGFSIRDTGIGISDEQCQRIFDGFSQAEASTARRYGGTGLGLAISQRLVRLMGGSLRVSSALGQGSVFDFVVDCRRAAPAPAPAAEPVSAQLRGLSCLVVDDNPVAREVVGEMASSFGWQVDVAEGGHQALAAVARRQDGQPYDVVFIDWRMPALDGWETSCQIRAMAPAGKTPLIVMVTAHDRELLAQRHGEMAPVLDGFVVKPVTASMLFDAVADARLGRRVPLAAVAAPSQQRLRGLRLLLVDDNPTNQQVASELLGNDGARVAVAGNGQAAIDAVATAADDNALPDLILMDIQMPDMDGYTATRLIRERLGGRAPPIVAMTANAMAADRQAALEAGMVDHVGKPFDLAQLIEVIVRHTSGQGAAPSAHAGAPGDGAGLAVSVLDSGAALRRLGGMHGVYLIALRSFELEAVQMEAQLRQAREERNAAAARIGLHTLKGLSGTVGAEQLAQLAAEAERVLVADPDSAWPGLDAVLAAVPAALAAIDRVALQLEAAVEMTGASR